MKVLVQCLWLLTSIAIASYATATFVDQVHNAFFVDPWWQEHRDARVIALSVHLTVVTIIYYVLGRHYYKEYFK